MTTPGSSTPELVDPEAAFLAGNPGELHAPDYFAPIPEPERRHPPQWELAAAALLAFTLVRQHLSTQGPGDDPQLTAREAWRKVSPLWLQAAVPALQELYRLHAPGTPDELAAEYARSLGAYLNDTSADALTDGFERQLAAGWNERVAWTRARAGYGLAKREMRSYLDSFKPGNTSSVELVPAASRALIDKAVLARAERIGQAESHSAAQAARRIVWMSQAQHGQLSPDSLVEWDFGDEDPCPVCRELHGQRVALTEPFVEPSGRKLWAPQAHPGCACQVRLVRPELAKAATSVAGLCVRAADTGRVLLLQRAQDPRDPNGGLWEFPGGHLEHGESPEAGAVREWQEEVGRRLPPHRAVGSWHHGIYQGFIVEVPREDQVPTHRRGSIVNPDDPDRDQVEAIAWWDLDHLARNRAVRPEVRLTLGKVRAAMGELAKAYDPSEPRDRDGRWTEGARVKVAERDPVVDALMEQAREQPPEPTSPYKAASPYTSSPYKPPSPYAPKSPYASSSPYAPKSPYAGAPEPRRGRKYVTHMVFLSRPKATLDAHYLDVADFLSALGFEHESIGLGSPVDFDEANVNLPADQELTAQRLGNAWDAVASPTGLRDEDELAAESAWHDVLRLARPVWQNAQENADEIAPRLSHLELQKIADTAGYDPTEDPRELRRRIVAATRRADDVDNSLADAYGDYVTFVHPEWATADASDLDLALDDALGNQRDTDALFLSPPQVFAFANGVHPGTRVDRGEHELYPEGNYYVAGLVYHSRIAQAPGQIAPQVIGMQELLLKPDPGE